jgi:two-component system response regulator YesN
MLVDDEILVRETIQECIQWEKEGFLFVGDAPDGEIALQLIEQLQPDILITDIMMPFMDGLELSGIVRKRMPHVKIVILSGHGEFEYARTALHLGVEEYCLKPVSAASILQLLHRVGSKIDAERLQQEQARMLLQSETEKKTMTKEKLLGELCCGFLTASEAIRWSSSLSIDLIAPYYVVVISDERDIMQDETSRTFERDASQHSANNTLERDKSQHSANMTLGRDASQHSASMTLERDKSQHSASMTLERDASRTLDEMQPAALSFRSAVEGLSYKRSRSETVWIVTGESRAQLDETLEHFRKQRKQANNTGNKAAAIGIGSIYDRLQSIHLSYLEAEEDMHEQRLSRQNRIDMNASAQALLDPALFLERSRFMDFLRLGQPAEVEAFITTYMAEINRQNWDSSPLGYYLLNDLTVEVLHVSQQSFRISYKEALTSLQSEISTIRTSDEASAYLVRLAKQYWSWRTEGADRYSELIDKVKTYIEEHYDKDYISLQSASDYVQLSPSHLSKVFSQGTGQTFIEHLTQTRMKKAMELLLTTPAKSYEVAFLVGYNDAHYFSNLFKRVTGMTTKQFRKNGGLTLETKGDGYAPAFKHG